MTILEDIADRGICFCGGEINCDFLTRTYTCSKCGFCISFNKLISVTEHNVLHLVKSLYEQFQQSKTDPMNVLPSYYKKSV